ncbi:tRNA (guanosine(37)-N1)-methyltransferase TrmD [Lolliginicoccus suaedae]|uniref:tRNA (guanosine(37)-N1)-methyltransferase TrmD n=1 Tax=Lolliginicoccus suaedae TaxID=2605429 RepID=UPI0011ECF9BB|nr:tRNA (guanosine(37)-N1)-methyltransferase TrmD [Lolliginicoccus suaedae]
MRLDVITIFPEYLRPLRESLLGKARERGLIDVGIHDLRDWTSDVHKSVDDSPYGGGPGMVMKPTVWGPALDDVCPDDALLVFPTPAGQPFTQRTAERWSREPRIVFACGRYEGIDQRVIDDAGRRVRVEEVSLGDYILIGGEVAVLVMVEAVARLLPGVLGNQQSHQEDSFSDGLLEGPSYTRPASWRGLDVPPILLSGDHARVASWKRQQSLRLTAQRRPELLDSVELSAADQQFLATVEADAPRAE